MNLLDSCDSTAEKKIVYSSLGFTGVEALKQRTLEWARDEVVLQDFFYPMAATQASGAKGSELSWKFLQNSWPAICKRLEGAVPAMLEAVIYCCARGTQTAKR